MSFPLNLLLLLFIFIASSCAVDPEAVKLANYRDVRMLLSDKKCSRAMDILEDMDDVDDDPVWYSLKASAEACEGDYSELSLVSAFADAGTLNEDNLLSAFASLSTSVMTEADVDAYSYPQTAINTLLFSNDEDDEPSAEARVDDFGDFHGVNINWQLLWLLTYNLGKYSHHYGNTSTAGVKDAGDGANNCFLTYSDADTRVYLLSGAVTTICTGAVPADLVGSTDLDDWSTDSTARRRVCEGIILFNNWFSIFAGLGSTSQTESVDVPTLSELSDAAEAVYDAGSGYKGEDVFTFTSHETCEDYIEAGGDNLIGIEQYFTFTLEVMSDVPP
ncbi:hypothetical protein N9N67_12215 [Bacteriovoracaceae bacterium]|nr:hypothetical protein [Bacteriovoracaceae bacterium]